MGIKNGVSTHDDSPTQYEGPHKFFWCSRRLYPWANTHKKNKKFARFLKKMVCICENGREKNGVTIPNGSSTQ